MTIVPLKKKVAFFSFLFLKFQFNLKIKSQKSRKKEEKIIQKYKKSEEDNSELTLIFLSPALV